MQYPNSNRFKQEDVYFNIFISIDRSQLSSIPNTDTWLIYEEDKKQVTKLDGLLSQIDYPPQQSWNFMSATTSNSK